MKIVIDDILDSKTGAKIGELFIDTAGPLPQHPTAGRQCTDWNEWLTAMNADPAARAKGGWAATPANAQGHPTLWAKLVAAANGPGADPAVSALGLSGT